MKWSEEGWNAVIRSEMDPSENLLRWNRVEGGGD